MKSLITALSSGILFLYPFAIYFGLKHYSPSSLALVFLVLLLLRLMLIKNTLVKMPWILPAAILGGGAISVTFFTQSTVGFKLYPLMVNLAMFCVFSYSCFKPPTVIETFARIKEKNLNNQGVLYTKKVTLVWCLFFLLNGSISLYTALFASFDHWLLYNGFISYILMALLMTVEYLIRRKVKQYHLQSERLVQEKKTSE